jgi:hypothetical protein
MDNIHNQALEYRDAVYRRLMLDVRGIVADIAKSDDPFRHDRIAGIVLEAGYAAERVALEFLERVARG